MAFSLVTGIGPVRGRGFLVSVKGLIFGLCACTRLVGGLFGKSAKGPTRLLIVRVFGLRSRDRVQRRPVGEGAWRTTFR